MSISGKNLGIHLLVSRIDLVQALKFKISVINPGFLKDISVSYYLVAKTTDEDCNIEYLLRSFLVRQFSYVLKGETKSCFQQSFQSLIGILRYQFLDKVQNKRLIDYTALEFRPPDFPGSLGANGMIITTVSACLACS